VRGRNRPGPHRPVTATPDKPVGTVFVTILIDGHAHEYRVLLKGDASAMRQQAADYIYQQLTELLNRLQPMAKHDAAQQEVGSSAHN
jgi:hypothetical protein